MHETLKITVIVPTFKPQGYLWECLDSLCNQDYPIKDYEIIVILNGCCEPYYQDLKDYVARNHAQIVLLQTDTGGVSNARNMGLDIARGEYVTFVDDDDYVSPKYLRSLYEAITPSSISVARPIAFYDTLAMTWKEYPITLVYNSFGSSNEVSPSKARRYFSGPWMKLIPMSFIQGRRFNPKFANGEDGLFNYLISDKIKIIRVASSDAVYYRRYREGSAVMTQRNRSQRIANNSRILREEVKIYLSNPRRYSLKALLRNAIGLCWSAIN